MGPDSVVFRVARNACEDDDPCWSAATIMRLRCGATRKAPAAVAVSRGILPRRPLVALCSYVPCHACPGPASIPPRYGTKILASPPRRTQVLHPGNDARYTPVRPGTCTSLVHTAIAVPRVALSSQYLLRNYAAGLQHPCRRASPALATCPTYARNDYSRMAAVWLDY